ncbi:MAG: biotin--[acetyl-CoA-carboxylase] ligase [Anaerolineae bacterium]
MIGARPSQEDALATYRRGTGRFGRTLDYYCKVGSTNDLALEAGRRGAPEGLVIVADEQITGRGRLQRRWEAPLGTSLLLSIIFRPPEPFAFYAARATMVCGLALVSAVRAETGVAARLKWPNDLIVDRVTRGKAAERRTLAGWRKLAGMLSELGMEAGGPAYLVVGVGLNVNVPTDLLPRLAPYATSLLALTGQSVDRVALLDRLLVGVESRYEALLAGTDPLPAWQAALAWMGEVVEVRTPAETVTGVAKGVDEEGALVLRVSDSEVRRFSAGDVSLRPARSARFSQT